MIQQATATITRRGQSKRVTISAKESGILKKISLVIVGLNDTAMLQDIYYLGSAESTPADAAGIEALPAAILPSRERFAKQITGENLTIYYAHPARLGANYDIRLNGVPGSFAAPVEIAGASGRLPDSGDNETFLLWESTTAANGSTNTLSITKR